MIDQKPPIPELFRKALESLNNVPVDQHLFVCHTWISKPTSDKDDKPRPACWILSAQTMEGAIECSHSIRSILEYTYIESKSKNINYDDVSNILNVLSQRVYLLLPEDAALIFADLNHSIILKDNKIDDLVIAPFTKQSGFRSFTIDEYGKTVPVRS